MMHGASWTDGCFLGLLLFTLLWLLKAYQDPAVRRSFHRLFEQKLALCFGVILFFFFMIAILDCIHLTVENRPGYHQTLLDRILSPLDSNEESTFSAPLALSSYVREIKLEEGEYRSVYPKLKYPSRYLATSEARNHFVFKMIGLGGICGLATYLFILFLTRNRQAYRTAWITLSVLVGIIVLLYGLSRQLHVFGTGKIGEDIFYYALKSVRTGLVIGVLTTLFTLPFALFFGVAAGYFGGWVDDMIQYVYTTLSSIPSVLLITASVLSLQTFIATHPDIFPTLSQQADARLLALCMILGVTSWTSLCRLLRAEALRLRQIDYVLAAQVLGVSSLKILRRHLLPNVMHIVMITLVLDFSYLILAEALLTYVGVGVSPMTISWGNMINSARLELARDPIVWWPVLAAFIMMFSLVLASNVFADAIEKAWNPRSLE